MQTARSGDASAVAACSLADCHLSFFKSYES